MKIYHNPRCSKSRNGLKYITEKGYEFEIIKYLEEGITEEELSDLISKTGKNPFDFVRTHETLYKKEFKGKEFSDQEWIKILVENPKLLHRPIIINGDKAVLANPPENVEEII